MDGCPSGWTCLGLDNNQKIHFEITKGITQTLRRFPNLEIILIDIPIGLLDGKYVKKFGYETRPCDMEARNVLKWPRTSSIFNPPCREALYKSDYQTSNEVNKRILGKGLSKQAWNISDKIRELDLFIRKNQNHSHLILESHPEVIFWAFNQQRGMEFNKKKRKGIEERLKILNRETKTAGIRMEKTPKEVYSRLKKKGHSLSLDDVLDAWILMIAGGLANGDSGKLCFLPKKKNKGHNLQDTLGLPMKIHFPPIEFKEPL